LNLLQTLLNTVFPVFLLAGLGFVARKVVKIEVGEPARMAIYVLTPGLIMNGILNAQMSASEAGRILLFALALTAVMIGMTLGVGRLAGWKQREGSAAVLSTAFMNSANYGLPVVLLAFGQAGFERAAIFVVVESLLMYTVAVFFAARGRLHWRQAAEAVLRLPLIWAAALAMAIRLMGITLPIALLKPIELLADGAIVVMVLLLGMQVASITLKGAWFRITVATLLRLVVSPLVGLGIVTWLNPEPLTAKVLVLLAAMPAAVNTTLLAVQFDADPDTVSGVTLTTTLLSVVTVTLWVWYLQL
jgi:predicted permease